MMYSLMGLPSGLFGQLSSITSSSMHMSSPSTGMFL